MAFNTADTPRAVISPDEILSLEDYSSQRADYRIGAMKAREARKVMIGDNLHFQFESRRTVLYQAQEVLRAEKIFEASAVQEELDTYGNLISAGNDLIAVMMIEFADSEERRIALAGLGGIEHRVYLDFLVNKELERCNALADEDLDRSYEGGTSAVHYLRFHLSQKHLQLMESPDATVNLCVEEPKCGGSVALSMEFRQLLAEDLKQG